MKKSPLAITRTAQLLSLLAAASLAAPTARATSDTWNGIDGTWATGTNWLTNPAVVPGTGDTATFSGAGFLTVAGSGATINTLAFDSTALGFNVTGLNLDAGGAITVANGAAAQTVAAVTTLGAATVTNNGTNGLSLGITHATAGTALTFDGTGTTTTSGALAAAGTTASIVKNGSGTLTLGNFSNTNIQGGFTVNGGTVIANNANALSNRNLTLGAGSTVQMNTSNAASFNFATSNISVTGDTTLFYNNTAGNWNIGNNAATSVFGSTGAHTVTFTTAVPNINGIRIVGNNSTFSGTYKLGLNGALTFNGQARGSSASTLNMGDAGSGSHYFSTGVILHDQTTQTITPIKFGALTGADPGALMTGRQNPGVNTVGTQFEIGSLNTSTTYAGTIRDGHTSNGNIAMNGLPNATNQTVPFTSNYARNAGAAGAAMTTELVKTGTGTLTLTGTNSHTGGTVIRGGTIAVSSDAALGATYDGSLRPFSFIPAATTPVVYSNTDLPNTVLTGGSPTTAANINLYSSAFGNNANGNLFISFSTQNPDTAAAGITNLLADAGAGYISVPTVSFTGGTIASGTTMPVASVRVTGLLTLDGGTLQTDAGITSNRAIVIGAGNGTIATAGFSSTFSGNINGSGNLALNGGGTVTLSAANALTGVVTVGANTTLNLSGSLAGTVTVDATGHLAGSGSAAGIVVNGEISPGNSIGTLTFNGNTTLAGISTMELDPGAATADLINVTAGSITLGGDLNISLLSAAAPGMFNIIDAPLFSGSFANVNLPALSGGLTWDTTLLNSQGILQIVPEPGSVSMLALAMGLLARRRQRTR